MKRAVLAAGAIVLLGACGGGGEATLDVVVAEQLAAPSDIAAAWETPCADDHRLARELQQRVIVLINRGQIPSELQEPLQAKVNVLVDDTSRCSTSAARRFRELAEWLRERAE